MLGESDCLFKTDAFYMQYVPQKHTFPASTNTKRSVNIIVTTKKTNIN